MLTGAGIHNAQREARWLAEAAEDDDAILDLARRRVDGEPLQYLTGIAGFRHLELAVGPGVLVPRPETEGVAGRAAELLPPDGIAIDVGTGSGAIALALAAEVPGARVFATDISEDALRWAERNRERAGLAVELVLGDLFEGLPSVLGGTVDVVVSNPPYVSLDERAALPADVVEHEPHVALFAGSDGTSVIRRICGEAPGWLRVGGWLVLEIAPTQADVVTELLNEAGFADVRVDADLAGLPRVVSGRTR